MNNEAVFSVAGYDWSPQIGCIHTHLWPRGLNVQMRARGAHDGGGEERRCKVLELVL